MSTLHIVSFSHILMNGGGRREEKKKGCSLGHQFNCNPNHRLHLTCINLNNMKL